MESSTTLDDLTKQGQAAFRQGEFQQAAEIFKQAIEIASTSGESLMAAEMANNQSVSLLKSGDAVAAFQAADGTDNIFAAAGDIKRQGMAVGNQAAALEGMGKLKEAELKYEESVKLLDLAGDSELRSLVLQSLSALKLRRHDQFGALSTMQSALTSKKKLSLPERFLNWLLRIVNKILNR